MGRIDGFIDSFNAECPPSSRGDRRSRTHANVCQHPSHSPPGSAQFIPIIDICPRRCQSWWLPSRMSPIARRAPSPARRMEREIESVCDKWPMNHNNTTELTHNMKPLVWCSSIRQLHHLPSSLWPRPPRRSLHHQRRHFNPSPQHTAPGDAQS